MKKDNNNSFECVGSLLVNTNDMKELSEVDATINNNQMTMMHMSAPNLSHDVECVGSLVLPTHDIKELSSSGPLTPTDGGGSTTLKRRVTVGTLLVSTDDLQSPPPPSK